MYSINFRKKNRIFVITFIFVLLSTASAATVGAIGKALEIGGESSALEPASFAFLSDNPITRQADSHLARLTFSSLSGLQLGKSAAPAEASVFTEFDAWVREFIRNGDQSANEQSMAAGELLAVKRRELLKQLIEIDPQAALARALPEETIAQLPESVGKYLERRVSANGDFLVYVSDAMHYTKTATTGSVKAGTKLNGARTERTVVIGDARYKASVYGRRERMTTKLGIPLQGIVIDERMAVDEAVAKVLDKQTLAAEIGGRRMSFTSEAEMDSFIGEEIEWESKIGPVRAKTQLENRIRSAETAASSWTEGLKTVLIIRVDFQDQQGEPKDYNGGIFTKERAESLYNNEINQFYVNNSYNKASVKATATSVVRLPQTLAYYKQQFAQTGNFTEMIQNARDAAKGPNYGYNTDSYDFDVVAFTYTGLSGGVVGLSTIGSKGSVLNGAFFLADAAHELGHNFGLSHANLWRTTDGKPNGQQGFNVEYGDCYDMMAADCSGLINQNTHFNARYKLLLNWLTENFNVINVTKTGDYTIYAQDAPTNNGTVRLLKISTDEKNYWVEFRQLITDNQNAMNGALIRWDQDFKDSAQTQLLDMTPNTPASVSTRTHSTGDEPLLASNSPFYDVENGIKISVLGKGNTTPESLVIRVEFVADCTYSLSPASATINQTGNERANTIVTTKKGCSLKATSNTNWLTVESVDATTGAVSVKALPNTGAQRIGTVTISAPDGSNAQTFFVTQVSGRCIDSIVTMPTPLDFPIAGGALSYSHSCNSATPTSDGTSDWINITTNPITVSPNSGLPRSGTLRLLAEDNGQFVPVILNVHQAGQGATCTFSISPANKSFTSASGAGSFNLTASDSSCAWSAAASDSWISVTGSASGTGSATINFNVSANNSPVRSGTITVGGRIFTVSQADGCVYSLQTASSGIVNASGATSSFTLQTGAGCSWTAATGDSWITINSNTFGPGTGTVNYTVAANAASAARAGTIIAGNQTFTVNQAGGCVFSLSSTSVSFGNGASSGSLSITANPGCVWTAVSNNSWITVTSGGSGSGAVNFAAAANTGKARTGTITVAGQTFTINQIVKRRV